MTKLVSNVELLQQKSLAITTIQDSGCHKAMASKVMDDLIDYYLTQ